MKKALLFQLVLLIFLSGNILFSQNQNDKPLATAPFFTEGNDFWLTVPIPYSGESGFNNYIKLMVRSHYNAIVTVEIPGKGWIQTRTTNPEQVLEFDIEPGIALPYVKADTTPEIPEQVYQGAGIHVYSDKPIILYCIVAYHYTSDGFLAIPTATLGNEYIIAGYSVDPMFRAVWEYYLPGTSGITGVENDTKIRFTKGGNKFSQTAGGLKSGQTVEFNLNKGDVWMVSTKGDAADLTGSKIVSDKPVSVVTGNMCANIPNGNQWCDYIAEMDIPTQYWSTDVFIPKIPGRKYSSLIRIFGKEPQTKFYRDGKQIGYLKNAGGVEGEAWLEMRMLPMDQSPRSIVISGDKPISVTLYNTSVQEDAGVSTNSDPFSMTFIPLENFSNYLYFFVPNHPANQHYNINYLGLVYETDSLGLMPDEYEITEYIPGNILVDTINKKYSGSDELFKFKPNGKQFALKTISMPSSGVFSIKSKGRLFTASSYGFSNNDSYGFPSGGKMFDRQFPVISVSDFDFGSKEIGKNSAFTATIRNEGNLPLSITGYTGPANKSFTTDLPKSSDLSMNPIVIPPLGIKEFLLQFSPASEGIFKDSILFHSDAFEYDSIMIISGNGIPTDVTEESVFSDFTIAESKGSLYRLNYIMRTNIEINIIISDILGTKLREISKMANLGLNSEIIDLSAYSSGIYLIYIQSGKNIRFQKIIKY